MTGQKTGGREAGTQNKVTVKVKEAIIAAVQNMDIEADLQALDPEKRLEMLVKLLPYCCTKYSPSLAETIAESWS